MPVHIGSFVDSPAWDTQSGFLIDTFRVLAKDGGDLLLEHVGRSFPGGRQEIGGHWTTVRPEWQFEAPLIERAELVSRGASDLLRQFA